MSRKINIFNAVGVGCPDADVAAFLLASGISSSVIEDALCDLVTGLKADGTWAKLQVIYPMVGGTAFTHGFNLKDPRNLDAAFRMTFLGGWVHSATGALPNGTNGYARTFWNAATQATASSVSQGMYSRTNITGANYVYGLFAITGTKRMWHNLNGNFQILDGSVITYTANPSTRMFISYRDSISFNESFRDGVSLGSSITAMTTLPSLEFYFGALNLNGSSISLYTRHEMAFGFLGDAITGADVTSITNRVNTFQTALSRNV